MRMLLVPSLVLATGMLAGSALADPPSDTPSLPVRAFLCDSAAHAMQFADILAEGQVDEIAKDRVGRSAKADVCGMYRGIAAIESETVALKNGVAYKVTAFRFKEDGRVAWLAETSFAPPKSAWDL